MKYINADIILPEELLKEVQKYVQGGMVYIPKPEGLRKKWGENSRRVYLKKKPGNPAVVCVGRHD